MEETAAVRSHHLVPQGGDSTMGKEERFWEEIQWEVRGRPPPEQMSKESAVRSCAEPGQFGLSNQY